MADELERAIRQRDLGLLAEPRSRGVAPRRPGLMDMPGGIAERLGLLNQFFNPVEAIGQSMRAGERMASPNVGGYDRLAALGDMLSGVAGVAGPAAAVGRAGAPAAAAVMEGLLGGSPTTQAAGDMARQFAMDESGALRLFHGSPHDFDRFSMDKIGTGEGAQAYGHGLYFAENEGIARGYRDALTTPVDYRGGGYPGADTNLAAKKVADAMGPNSDPANVIASEANKFRYQAQQMQSRLDGQPQAVKEANARLAASFENIAAEIERLNPADFKLNKGRLYEVNVNANPEDFLDWDKPLSAQPERVREALTGVDVRAGNMSAKDRAETINAALTGDPRLAHLLRDGTINSTADTVYKGMADTLGGMDWPIGADAATRSQFRAQGAAKATTALREAGIPGIRYLDAGSRGAGDGSRNYVVFDENLISIVRKYGIAGAAAMLGISQADVAQAMQQQQPRGLLSMGAQ